MKQYFVFCVSAFALGACSGGSDTVAAFRSPLQSVATGWPEPIEPPTTQNFIGLLAPGSGNQRIEGFGFRRVEEAPDGSQPATEVMYLFGVRDPATGRLRITDGVRLLDDPDGNDGTAGFPSYNDFDPAGPQINAQVIGLQSSVFGAYGSFAIGSSSTVGASDVIYGVSSNPGSMPASGTASYIASSGNATRVIRSGGVVTTVSTGTLSVDFSAGLVNVSVFATSPGAGFDEVRATALPITGNTFYGSGTTTLRNSGADVTTAVAGTVVDSRAGGIFLGPTDPLPAEVGAVLKIDGTNFNVIAPMIGTRVP